MVLITHTYFCKRNTEFPAGRRMKISETHTPATKVLRSETWERERLPLPVLKPVRSMEARTWILY